MFEFGALNVSSLKHLKEKNIKKALEDGKTWPYFNSLDASL